MPQWYPIQYDFSGGAVDLSFIMRQDLDAYRKSVLRMENFMPMLTGSARRTPGSLYLQDIGGQSRKEARIMPYISGANERVLVQLTEGNLKVISGLLGFGTQGNANGGNRKQILANPEFQAGLADWEFDPPAFTGGNGDELGCKYVNFDGDGAIRVVCRNWKFPNLDNETAFVRTSAVVDVPTDKLQFSYRILYESNPGESGFDYIASIRLGTTEGANDIGTINLNNLNVGDLIEQTEFFDVSPGFTGVVYVRFDLEATQFASTPNFLLDRFTLFADSDTSIDTVDLAAPYADEDLAQIQYLASPHGNKELFFVHPKYPPYWFYFDPVADEYKMEAVPFNTPPGEWDTDNYPSTLTAYQGRLYLSGVPSDPEIIWGTKVFVWTDITPPGTDPAPDDAIKFVTTFRSPTVWMAGHKDLVIGARELEYIVRSQTGIIQAGDIDPRVHSSHGGAPVQPVGYGQFVAFAADRGRRLRAIQLNRENEGWIAPDKSILNPTILRSGIKRLARMRNPHQMVVCLLNNGRLAILHEDTTAGVSGWSVYDVNSNIRDICVLPRDDGLDVLFMVVDRIVNGRVYTYLEAIVDWAQDFTWFYTNSSLIYSFTEPTSTITGLDHLEGNRVQVVANDGYVGTFLVQGGQVELVDGNGVPQPVNNAIVGMGTRSTVFTLPPVVPPTVGGAGSTKRYVNTKVRLITSAQPIINGQRPPERSPDAIMNQSQPLDLTIDSSVVNLGHDELAIITIEEDLPIRVEFVGIFGKLAVDAT